MEMEANLLVVILDVSPAQEHIRCDSRLFYDCVEALITFCNSHLMTDGGNQVAIIGTHLNQSYFLYPDEEEDAEAESKQHLRQQDGQYEGFFEFESVVRTRIKQIVGADDFLTSNMMKGDLTSCIASALGRALCYISRIEKTVIFGTLKSRILVVSGGLESTNQYMSYMNMFFAAQKKGVTIDGFVLGPNATLLGQGTSITRGIYYKPPSTNGLLQYLLSIFLPDAAFREILAPLQEAPVDLRATCICHHKLIEVGFVCTSCLSVFCELSPICTTCRTVFKHPMVTTSKEKKKQAAAKISEV